MPKKGKLCGGTNYKAYEDFVVHPDWILGYMERQEMHAEDGIEERPLEFTFPFSFTLASSYLPCSTHNRLKSRLWSSAYPG